MISIIVIFVALIYMITFLILYFLNYACRFSPIWSGLPVEWSTDRYLYNSYFSTKHLFICQFQIDRNFCEALPCGWRLDSKLYMPLKLLVSEFLVDSVLFSQLQYCFTVAFHIFDIISLYNVGRYNRLV